MSQSYDELGEATRILKERALDRHRRVLEQRNTLEQELHQIDGLRKEGQSDERSLLARRSIGADTAWQGWVLQRRAEVLRQAALCRAQQEASFAMAQEAFARHSALQTLARQEKSAARDKRAQKDAQSIAALGLLSQTRRD